MTKANISLRKVYTHDIRNFPGKVWNIEKDKILYFQSFIDYFPTFTQITYFDPIRRIFVEGYGTQLREFALSLSDSLNSPVGGEKFEPLGRYLDIRMKMRDVLRRVISCSPRYYLFLTLFSLFYSSCYFI